MHQAKPYSFSPFKVIAGRKQDEYQAGCRIYGKRNHGPISSNLLRWPNLPDNQDATGHRPSNQKERRDIEEFTEPIFMDDEGDWDF